MFDKKRINMDQFEGLIWIGLGICLCFGSIKLGLGTLHKPGSGSTPFLTGSLLGLLGLILVLMRMFFKQSSRSDNVEVPIKRFGKKGFYSLIVLYMYAFLLESLGFIITTFLLLFFLFKIMESGKWARAILLAIFALIVSYLIFEVWLRINFPAGLLKLRLR